MSSDKWFKTHDEYTSLHNSKSKTGKMKMTNAIMDVAKKDFQKFSKIAVLKKTKIAIT